MDAPLHVVWFKRDLRVHDHAALADACAAAREDGGRVLLLYLLEPALWREPDMAGRHYDFLRECLSDLRAAACAVGGRLVVRVGEAVETFEALREAHGGLTLWSHQETWNAWTYERDKAVLAWARGHGIAWHEPRQFGVIRRLPTRDGWAKRWDAFMAQKQRPAPALPPGPAARSDRLPSPAKLGLAPDPCPLRQAGGRDAGLEWLASFLQERGTHYRRLMSTPLEGEAACSRLSPYLAFGALSLREVAQATKARAAALREDEGAADRKAWLDSLRSFEGRLHWHCHFSQKLEDEPSLEHRSLHRGFDALRPAEADPERLAAWAEGRTGLPFLDACMRYVRASGWLNFRMRAMVMCVGSYHLWLPWRQTGLILARLFTDYEPGIHWPQSQMQSGTTGMNTLRIYNPVKQGYDQDPDGHFIRTWVPELEGVDDRFLQEPWRASEPPEGYPAPIVDVAEAARAARSRVIAARREPGFREETERVVAKHGSRRGPRRRPKAGGGEATRPRRKASAT